jgi:hypothetical protein
MVVLAVLCLSTAGRMGQQRCPPGLRFSLARDAYDEGVAALLAQPYSYSV